MSALHNSLVSFYPRSKLEQYLVNQPSFQNRQVFKLEYLVSTLNRIVESQKLFDPNNPTIIIFSHELIYVFEQRFTRWSDLISLILERVQLVVEGHDHTYARSTTEFFCLSTPNEQFNCAIGVPHQEGRACLPTVDINIRHTTKPEQAHR